MLLLFSNQPAKIVIAKTSKTNPRQVASLFGLFSFGLIGGISAKTTLIELKRNNKANKVFISFERGKQNILQKKLFIIT